MIQLIRSYCLCLVGDCAKMAGHRALWQLRSLYDTGSGTPAPSGEAEGSAPPQGRRRRRAAGRRPRAPPPQPVAAPAPEPEEELEEEQVDEQAQQGEAEHEAEQLDEHEAEQLDEQEQRQDEQEAEAGGSSSTATSGVYQRGAARLPDRPIPEALRPVIRPVGQKYVTFIFFATTYDRITMETNSFFLITYAGLGRSWSQVLTKGCPMASWVFSAGNTSQAWLPTSERESWPTRTSTTSAPLMRRTRRATRTTAWRSRL